MTENEWNDLTAGMSREDKSQVRALVVALSEGVVTSDDLTAMLSTDDPAGTVNAVLDLPSVREPVQAAERRILSRHRRVTAQVQRHVLSAQRPTGLPPV